MAEGLTCYRPNLLDYIPAADVACGWTASDRVGRAVHARSDCRLGRLVERDGGEACFHTHRRPILYPPAADFADVASGLIALSVSKTPRDYVLWFRPEMIQTVIWADY